MPNHKNGAFYEMELHAKYTGYKHFRRAIVLPDLPLLFLLFIWKRMSHQKWRKIDVIDVMTLLQVNDDPPKRKQQQQQQTKTTTTTTNARSEHMLIVTKLCNIAVSDICARKSLVVVGCSW